MIEKTFIEKSEESSSQIIMEYESQTTDHQLTRWRMNS